MEQQNVTEKKQIILWNLKARQWSFQEFMDSHPDYKVKHEGEEIYYWESLIFLGACLGLQEKDMRKLFDDRPEISYPDLVLLMFLTRLYKADVVDEVKRVSGQAPAYIHNFLKAQEGMIPYEKIVVEKQPENNDQTEEDEKNRADAMRLLSELENAVRVFQETKAVYDEKMAVSEAASEDLVNAKKKTDEATKDNTDPEIYQLRLQNALLEERIKSNALIAEGKYQQELQRKGFVIQRITAENEVLQKSELRMKSELQDSEKQLSQAEERIKELERQVLLLEQEAEKASKDKTYSEHIQKQRYEPSYDFRPSYEVSSSGRLWKRKPKLDARQKFLLEILHSDKYPEYQKEFIDKCFMEGMPLEYLEEFKEPGISEENLWMMKRVLLR